MTHISFILTTLVLIFTLPLWGTWFLVRALLGIKETFPYRTLIDPES